MKGPPQKKAKSGYKQASLLSFFNSPSSSVVNRPTATISEGNPESVNEEDVTGSQDSDIVVLRAGSARPDVERAKSENTTPKVHNIDTSENRVEGVQEKTTEANSTNVAEPRQKMSDSAPSESNTSHQQPTNSEIQRTDEDETLAYNSQASSLGLSQSSDGAADLGAPVSQFRAFPEQDAERTAKRPSDKHVILVKTPTTAGQVPQPSADHYADFWDEEHVRLACSPKNLYPGGDSQDDLRRRWTIIESALLSPMTSSYDIEEAILSYNSRYRQKWDFTNLHAMFRNYMNDGEREHFFQNVLPSVVQLALSLPSLITSGIPLLTCGKSRSLTLSQNQTASLVANAFFCTFPRRNATHRNSEYSNYPTINMAGLFGTSAVNRRGRNRDQSMQNKLKCLAHYFTRISETMPTGCITYKRKVITGPDAARWSSSTEPISSCRFSSTSLIEDADGMAQVDFANCRVGGGALRTGCVQEEIQFLLHPELIVSRLFTEKLADNEVLIIKGAERYSSYSGYADNFEFTGDFEDNTSRDSLGRRYRHIIAMDATKYGNALTQYDERAVLRELNKAYCGFHSSKDQPVAISTGNWGCGAFRGDHRLKGVIQMMAASQCHRQLHYSAFGDNKLKDDLHSFYEFCQSHSVTVGTLWTLVMSYDTNVVSRTKKAAQLAPDILRYIKAAVTRGS